MHSCLRFPTYCLLVYTFPRSDSHYTALLHWFVWFFLLPHFISLISLPAFLHTIWFCSFGCAPDTRSVAYATTTTTTTCRFTRVPRYVRFVRCVLYLPPLRFRFTLPLRSLRNRWFVRRFVLPVVYVCHLRSCAPPPARSAALLHCTAFPFSLRLRLRACVSCCRRLRFCCCAWHALPLLPALRVLRSFACHLHLHRTRSRTPGFRYSLFVLPAFAACALPPAFTVLHFYYAAFACHRYHRSVHAFTYALVRTFCWFPARTRLLLRATVLRFVCVTATVTCTAFFIAPCVRCTAFLRLRSAIPSCWLPAAAPPCSYRISFVLVSFVVHTT